MTRRKASRCFQTRKNPAATDHGFSQEQLLAVKELLDWQIASESSVFVIGGPPQSLEEIEQERLRATLNAQVRSSGKIFKVENHGSR